MVAQILEKLTLPPAAAPTVVKHRDLVHDIVTDTVVFGDVNDNPVPIARADGATPSLTAKGAADIGPAVTSTAAAQGSVIFGPSGTYTLNSTATIGEAVMVGLGANITGSQYLPVVDESARRASGVFFSRASAISGNAFSGMFSMDIQSTPLTGGVNYEKAGAISTVIHRDASVYSVDGDAGNPGILTRFSDGVSYEANMNVPVGNLRARTWTYDGLTQIGQPGMEGQADGLYTGMELRLENYGTTQPYYSTSTSKTNLALISGGTRDTTSAINILAANGTLARHGDGIMADTAALRTNFLALKSFYGGGVVPLDVFRLGADGSLSWNINDGAAVFGRLTWTYIGVQAFSMDVENATRTWNLYGTGQQMLSVKQNVAVGINAQAQNCGGTGIVSFGPTTTNHTSLPTNAVLQEFDLTNNQVRFIFPSGKVATIQAV